MSDFKIEFGPPPEPARPASDSRSVWAKRLAPLVERKGEWARVVTGNQGRVYSVRHNILRGEYAGIDEGDFEAVARRLDDEEWGLWVRYVGEKLRSKRKAKRAP